MEKIRRFTKFVSGILTVVLLGGCAHQLEIKNISQYMSLDYPAMDKKIRIAVQPSAEDVSTRQLADNVARELNRYAEVVYGNTTNADVVAYFDITPEYFGSGWNFLINWPGFLIWTPAWHGYVYTVNYDVDVKLHKPGQNEPFDHFKLPINLNIRHSSFDRTWTEISWLEYSVIAFVGGLVFIQYDDDVSPLIVAEEGPTLGNYIAKVIVSRSNKKLQLKE